MFGTPRYSFHALPSSFYSFADPTQGIPYSEYKSASGNSSAPPPPPPPPLPSAPVKTAPAGGAAAVFAELNKGEDITKSLRKVDKSQMTHKNPALRAGSTVPATTSSPATPGKKPIKPAKPSTLAGKKPSKFALEANKWIIVSLVELEGDPCQLAYRNTTRMRVH